MLLGKPYDGRADQFALAVTLYELLSASFPFSAPTLAALAMQQTTKAPVRVDVHAPSVPERLADVIHKALHCDPDKRFADCRTFAKEVLSAVKGRPRRVDVTELAGATKTADTVAVPTKVICPHCGKRLALPATSAGKRIRCPACKESFPVPDSVGPAKDSSTKTLKTAAKRKKESASDPDVAEAMQTAGVKIEPDLKPIRNRPVWTPAVEQDRPSKGRNWALLMPVTLVAVGALSFGSYAVYKFVNPDTEAPAPAGSPLPIAYATPQPNTQVPVRAPMNVSPLTLARADTGRSATPQVKPPAPRATGKASHPSGPGNPPATVPEVPANVRLLQGETGPIYAVAFVRDGTRVLSVSPNELCVWDVAADSPVQRFPLGVRDLAAAVFSADGTRLLGACGQADKPGPGFRAKEIHEWNVDTGAKLRTLTAETGAFQSIALAPDGRQALCGTPNGTELWDLDSGRVVQRFATGPVTPGVAFVPRAKQVLCASPESITRWDAVAGGHLEAYRTHGAHCLAVTADGKRFLAGGASLVARDLAIDHDCSRCPVPERLLALALSPDGRFAASAGNESVRLWTVDLGEESSANRFRIEGGATSLAFSHDGHNLVIGGADGVIRVWPLPNLRTDSPEKPVFPGKTAGKWLALIDTQSDFDEHWRQGKAGRATFDPVAKVVHVLSPHSLGSITYEGPWKELHFRVMFRSLPSRTLTLRIGNASVKLPTLQVLTGPIAIAVRFNTPGPSVSVFVDGKFVAQASTAAPRGTRVSRDTQASSDGLNCRLDSGSARPADVVLTDIKVLVND